MKKHANTRSTSGLLLLGLAVALAASAALVLAFAGGGPANEQSALAHIDPEECDPAIGSGNATIRIDAAPVTVSDGTVLNYRVGVSYPVLAGEAPGCTAFNIDVFLNPPGPVGFQLICNIPTLLYGAPITECPASYPYVANGAHRTGSLLVATVVAVGDKHDQPDDCLVPSPRDPTAPSDPICVHAANTSNISMPNTPTPSPTNTATNTPTATSTPKTSTNTPQATNTPRDRRNTPQPTNTRRPNTPEPARTNVVLASTPTRPPIGITLPPTGSDGTGGIGAGMTMLVAALAVGAAISAGAGVVVSRKRID